MGSRRSRVRTPLWTKKNRQNKNLRKREFVETTILENEKENSSKKHSSKRQFFSWWRIKKKSLGQKFVWKNYFYEISCSRNDPENSSRISGEVFYALYCSFVFCVMDGIFKYNSYNTRYRLWTLVLHQVKYSKKSQNIDDQLMYLVELLTFRCVICKS